MDYMILCLPETTLKKLVSIRALDVQSSRPVLWSDILELRSLFEVSKLHHYLDSNIFPFHAPDVSRIFWASLRVNPKDDDLYTHVGPRELCVSDESIGLVFDLEVDESFLTLL